jgi:hypothetical protein
MYKVIGTSEGGHASTFEFTDEQTALLILTGIGEHTKGTVTIEFIGEDSDYE